MSSKQRIGNSRLCIYKQYRMAKVYLSGAWLAGHAAAVETSTVASGFDPTAGEALY